MTGRIGNLVRLACVVALLAVNFAMPSARAEGACWDCKWCSDGESCCPSGSKWATCSKGATGRTCWVTKGGCSGGLDEGGDEEEVDADGEPYIE